jgi:hypothetical protein
MTLESLKFMPFRLFAIVSQFRVRSVSAGSTTAAPEPQLAWSAVRYEFADPRVFFEVSEALSLAYSSAILRWQQYFMGARRLRTVREKANRLLRSHAFMAEDTLPPADVIDRSFSPRTGLRHPPLGVGPLTRGFQAKAWEPRVRSGHSFLTMTAEPIGVNR